MVDIIMARVFEHQKLLDLSKDTKGCGLKMGRVTKDPKETVKDADVIVTDTWVSMGDEKEKKTRLRIFPP